MKRVIIILASGLLISSAVSAGDLYLDINGYSKHSKETYKYQGKQYEYNSTNVGFGLTYGFNKYVEASVGFYDNSYDRNTVYAGPKIKYDFVLGNVVITPGINIGVFTGYNNYQVQADKYQLIAVPNMRVTYCGVGLTVGYLPAIERNNPTYVPVSTIVVQINVRIPGL